MTEARQNDGIKYSFRDHWNGKELSGLRIEPETLQLLVDYLNLIPTVGAKTEFGFLLGNSLVVSHSGKEFNEVSVSRFDSSHPFPHMHSDSEWIFPLVSSVDQSSKYLKSVENYVSQYSKVSFPLEIALNKENDTLRVGVGLLPNLTPLEIQLRDGRIAADQQAFNLEIRKEVSMIDSEISNLMDENPKLPSDAREQSVMSVDQIKDLTSAKLFLESLQNQINLVKKYFGIPFDFNQDSTVKRDGFYTFKGSHKRENCADMHATTKFVSTGTNTSISISTPQIDQKSDLDIPAKELKDLSVRQSLKTSQKILDSPKGKARRSYPPLPRNHKTIGKKFNLNFLEKSSNTYWNGDPAQTIHSSVFGSIQPVENYPSVNQLDDVNEYSLNEIPEKKDQHQSAIPASPKSSDLPNEKRPVLANDMSPETLGLDDSVLINPQKSQTSDKYCVDEYCSSSPTQITGKCQEFSKLTPGKKSTSSIGVEDEPENSLIFANNMLGNVSSSFAINDDKHFPCIKHLKHTKSTQDETEDMFYDVKNDQTNLKSNENNTTILSIKDIYDRDILEHRNLSSNGGYADGEIFSIASLDYLKRYNLVPPKTPPKNQKIQ